MKKLIALSALCISVSALAAAPVKPECHHYFKDSSFQLEAISLNDSVSSQPLSDLDWDFKGTFTNHFTKYVYGSVDMVKLDKDHWGYGASSGVEDTYKHFTPYAEISYSHSYTDEKNVSDKQFNYDAGVKLAYFSRFTPYVEADDFVNSQEWYVKTGAQYTINKRYYVLADYSFQSRTQGNKLGFGAGIQF